MRINDMAALSEALEAISNADLPGFAEKVRAVKTSSRRRLVHVELDAALDAASSDDWHAAWQRTWAAMCLLDHGHVPDPRLLPRPPAEGQPTRSFCVMCGTAKTASGPTCGGCA